MSDDTPTEATPTETAPSDDAARKDRRRTLLIIVSVIALILLLAVTVLLTLLLSGLGKTDEQPVPSLDPSPSASLDPSESPSASAEPEGQASSEPSEEPAETTTPPAPPPPPPSNDPVITNFKAGSSTVACNTQSPQQFPAYISFTWATSKVDRVYFGVDTNDAQSAPLFDNLPPSGSSQSDFPPGYTSFEFGCPNPSHKYTLTVIGSNGKKVSKSVTITNVGDTQ